MGKLNEIVKNFLSKREDTSKKDSSIVQQKNVIKDLSGDIYPNTGSFFDDEQFSRNLFNSSEINNILSKQKEKIMSYRQLAMTPDVTDAIDEIVNEIIFTYDDIIPLKIDINEENDKLIKAIGEKFDKIMKLIDVKRNLFQIIKSGYIDGQIIIHTTYGNNIEDGINSIKLIEPCLLFFDTKNDTYEYVSQDMTKTLVNNTNESYSAEEIVREDFGLYDGKINLSYLEYAIKPANMLKTLEDLLIPLRFSRSISRRVFNVDIGDLPTKRGAEVMRDHQAKFKYKKFYNSETGEVSNQQHITSMVEDYWFANRSGGKGTTVDVLDESGNLGELDDILYFSKKLYRALNIPSSRIDINPDADRDFEFDSTRVTKEDMKFFMFISRIRQVYSSLFKEILRREIISTEIMSNEEWVEKEDSISILFVNENKFIEKMKLDNYMSKIDVYNNAFEHIGKLFSAETLIRDIFRKTDDDIKEESKKIDDEKKSEVYKRFYPSDADN
jgi:hypothetical protein